MTLLFTGCDEELNISQVKPAEDFNELEPVFFGLKQKLWLFMLLDDFIDLDPLNSRQEGLPFVESD